MKLKKFCSIGTQTDDFSSSDDVFEGLVPYRKPIIQDVQIYQTPKDCVQKSSNVQIQKCEDVVQIRKPYLKPII